MRRLVAALVVLGMVVACGSPAAPPASSDAGGPSTAASPGTSFAVVPGGSSEAVVPGPVSNMQPTIDTAADSNVTLQASEDAERARGRSQAGFSAEYGSGWDALSTAADEATDAAAQSLADQFAPIASVGAVNRPPARTPASAAAALALLGAALAASQSLGLGGTLQPTVNETSTSSHGDSTATVTVSGQGVSISTGSRVWADFTFDLSGSVTNSTTGATATMTGSAHAHIEIDGCPDASGSSKGKVSLSSKESASNGVGWTRDLTGDFDITVDDDGNISKFSVDAQAQESVQPKGESDGHELGIKTHAEFAAGPGFSPMTHNAGALTLEVTKSTDATSADLGPLFTSALTAVTAGAHILGSAAEKFWRDGKCIEVIVAPAGGDVDPSSVTEVTVKVKQKFEGNELNKPVEAALSGVKTIDPAGTKQPAPATFKYTAGVKDGDRGDIELKSVSNRGIGKKSVTFTVHAVGWMTTATSPLGDVTGKKCDGLGGPWTINGVEHLGPLTVTTKVVVTINLATLEGTFDFHKDQVGAGTVTTHQSNGSARIVQNEDGSVTMTLDPAKIYLHTKNAFGGSGSATTQGAKLVYPWTPATARVCS